MQGVIYKQMIESVITTVLTNTEEGKREMELQGGA